MKVTKREVIASISIIAVMLVLGFILGDKIQDRQNDKNAEYYKAVHIDNTELFQYGMDTNVGNAFVYGDLNAIDTVTFDEIGGEYMYVEKVEEHYNRHTRVVTRTRNVNGRTQTYTETEVYYSWDYHDSWDKHSENISFCGVDFDYGKIKKPSSDYITTLDGGYHVRFKYYGVEPTYTGTVYTNLFDGTINDNSDFLANKNIDESIEYYTASVALVLFWIFWILLSCGAVVGFYYLDNRWLE